MNAINWNALFFQIFCLAGTYLLFGTTALGWAFFGFAILIAITMLKH